LAKAKLGKEGYSPWGPNTVVDVRSPFYLVRGGWVSDVEEAEEVEDVEEGWRTWRN
jgi:hypothetical protein